MHRWVTITLCLGLGGLFAWSVPLERLFDVFLPAMTALSIMAAAVLVRLNRTMPAIDWKILDKASRERLTSEVVALTEEYLWFLAVIGMLILGILALLVVGREAIFGVLAGPTDPDRAWYWWWRRASAGMIGAGSTFVVVRMGYLVWRDLDIVRLQKHVIDLGAAQADQAAHEKLAAEKLANMDRANLRAVPISPPKAWGQ